MAIAFCCYWENFECLITEELHADPQSTRTQAMSTLSGTTLLVAACFMAQSPPSAIVTLLADHAISGIGKLFLSLSAALPTLLVAIETTKGFMALSPNFAAKTDDAV